MVERGTGPKSLLEKIKRMPRAWSLLGYVRDVLCLCRTSLCVSHPLKVGPFSGEPCPPFYRPRGEQGLQMGERGKKQGYTRSFEGSGLPSFLRLPFLTWQTMSEVACLLIFIGHALAPFSKWVRLIPCRRTVRRAGELSSDPSGSNRGSDHTSVTVDDVSSVLDRSGRRMPVLVSVPEN